MFVGRTDVLLSLQLFWFGIPTKLSIFQVGVAVIGVEPFNGLCVVASIHSIHRYLGGLSSTINDMALACSNTHRYFRLRNFLLVQFFHCFRIASAVLIFSRNSSVISKQQCRRTAPPCLNRRRWHFGLSRCAQADDLRNECYGKQVRFPKIVD